MAARFRVLTGLGLMGAVALAAGCGAPPSAGGSASASGEMSDVKACLVSDEGGFQDKSFNQSAKQGLDRAVSELGVQSATAESHSSAEYAPMSRISFRRTARSSSVSDSPSTTPSGMPPGPIRISSSP